METFEKLDVDTARSSEGYEVEIVGRDRVVYRESQRSVRIPSGDSITEHLLDGVPVFTRIYLSYARRWDTPEGESEISAEEKIIIAARLRAALAFLDAGLIQIV